MQVSAVHIENFRSIEKLTVKMDGLTTIIGANNAGKSTILLAIQNFFSANPKMDEKDHIGYDRDRDIHISVTFSNLTSDEKEEFGSAVIEDTMTVSRIFGNEHSGEFFVTTKSVDEFIPIYETSGKRDKKTPMTE
ncbi:AAA family ATPase [Notoacmeibacter ruber]|uniref:DUF2813 domain-containing protein n=1 Tax=Notoacmeibacter ruber TaxID=2670375 RepID=A0A3L7JDZ7_9HYPH|nr:AAA family ATPase [Notoacmeibacter ruber]RLQ88997.1 DUF2813 domain-containing protein [Notoacmeibacter ruber]